MNQNPYKFLFRPNFAADTIEFSMAQVGCDKKYYIPKEIVWVEHKMGEISTPCLNMYPEDAQAMMDALFAAGVRPSKEFGQSSQIESIKYHLEDMRRLVFKD